MCILELIMNNIKRFNAAIFVIKKAIKIEKVSIFKTAIQAPVCAA